MTGHRRRSFLVAAADEDALTGWLWQHGASGFHCREPSPGDDRLILDAWFAETSPGSAEALQQALPHALAQRVRALGEERVPRRDWLAEYRAGARPFDLGRGFRVDPRDPEDAAKRGARSPSEPQDRRFLRIPAQTAFGTGSHESTRLAVAWLEQAAPRGLDVLDVGTGSGVLALVAQHLGARRTVGLDIDPAAVCVARANARANDVEASFFAGGLAALRPKPARRRRFDLALVNVLPERIFDDLPRLLPLLRPGGQVVSSGNLASRRDELLSGFAERGLVPAGEPYEKRDGDWLAFLLRPAW